MQPRSPRVEVSGNAKELRARQPPRRDPETEGPSEPLPRSGLQPSGPTSDEIRPADLAARRSRERGHDPQVARRLEPSEFVATVLTELLEGGRIVRARRDDPRRHVIAPFGIGPAGD